MAQSIKADPTLERQLNLTVAMMSSPHGLTRAELFSIIPDYKTNSEEELKTASRMFERDKATLRESGVVFETVTDPETDSDSRTTRYRIPIKEYGFPSTIDFSKSELALLQLSAKAWADKTAAPEALSVIAKLRAMGFDEDESLAGNVPSIQLLPRGFELLSDAIAQHQAIEFAYKNPDAAHSHQRTVQPLHLFRHDGRWLLFSYDLERNSERMFLLDRFASSAKKSKAKVEQSAYGNEQQRAQDHIAKHLSNSRAKLSVTPGTVAALHLRRLNAIFIAQDDDALLIEIPLSDEELLAQELAGYGPEVLVLAPSSLQNRVIKKLSESCRALENGNADE